MRIIVSDPAQLDAFFVVFCHYAELNSDPNAKCNEENGWFHCKDMADGGWFHGDEDMVDGNDPESQFSDMTSIIQYLSFRSMTSGSRVQRKIRRAAKMDIRSRRLFILLIMFLERTMTIGSVVDHYGCSLVRHILFLPPFPFPPLS